MAPVRLLGPAATALLGGCIWSGTRSGGRPGADDPVGLLVDGDVLKEGSETKACDECCEAEAPWGRRAEASMLGDADSMDEVERTHEAGLEVGIAPSSSSTSKAPDDDRWARRAVDLMSALLFTAEAYLAVDHFRQRRRARAVSAALAAGGNETPRPPEYRQAFCQTYPCPDKVFSARKALEECRTELARLSLAKMSATIAAWEQDQKRIAEQTADLEERDAQMAQTLAKQLAYNEAHARDIDIFMRILNRCVAAEGQTQAMSERFAAVVRMEEELRSELQMLGGPETEAEEEHEQPPPQPIKNERSTICRGLEQAFAEVVQAVPAQSQERDAHQSGPQSAVITGVSVLSRARALEANVRNTPDVLRRRPSREFPQEVCSAPPLAPVPSSPVATATAADAPPLLAAVEDTRPASPRCEVTSLRALFGAKGVLARVSGQAHAVAMASAVDGAQHSRAAEAERRENRASATGKSAAVGAGTVDAVEIASGTNYSARTTDEAAFAREGEAQRSVDVEPAAQAVFAEATQAAVRQDVEVADPGAAEHHEAMDPRIRGEAETVGRAVPQAMHECARSEDVRTPSTSADACTELPDGNCSSSESDGGVFAANNDGGAEVAGACGEAVSGASTGTDVASDADDFVEAQIDDDESAEAPPDDAAGEGACGAATTRCTSASPASDVSHDVGASTTVPASDPDETGASAVPFAIDPPLSARRPPPLSDAVCDDGSPSNASAITEGSSADILKAEERPRIGGGVDDIAAVPTGSGEQADVEAPESVAADASHGEPERVSAGAGRSAAADGEAPESATAGASSGEEADVDAPENAGASDEAGLDAPLSAAAGDGVVEEAAVEAPGSVADGEAADGKAPESVAAADGRGKEAKVEAPDGTSGGASAEADGEAPENAAAGARAGKEADSDAMEGFDGVAARSGAGEQVGSESQEGADGHAPGKANPDSPGSGEGKEAGTAPASAEPRSAEGQADGEAPAFADDGNPGSGRGEDAGGQSRVRAWVIAARGDDIRSDGSLGGRQTSAASTCARSAFVSGGIDEAIAPCSESRGDGAVTMGGPDEIPRATPAAAGSAATGTAPDGSASQAAAPAEGKKSPGLGPRDPHEQMQQKMKERRAKAEARAAAAKASAGGNVAAASPAADLSPLEQMQKAIRERHARAEQKRAAEEARASEARAATAESEQSAAEEQPAAAGKADAAEAAVAEAVDTALADEPADVQLDGGDAVQQEDEGDGPQEFTIYTDRTEESDATHKNQNPDSPLSEGFWGDSCWSLGGGGSSTSQSAAETPLSSRPVTESSSLTFSPPRVHVPDLDLRGSVTGDA